MLGIKLNDRILGLDVLRALAILLVIYAHSMSVLQHVVPSSFLALFQFDGVALFFVLSGFLIGRILLKTIHHSSFDFNALLSFWARRWLRTLPAYFVVLTLLIILVFAIDSPMTATPFYQYFLFIQNLWLPHPFFFPEAWSLSVEEWFYLIFPFCLFFAAQFTKKQLSSFLSIVLSFLLFGLAYRYFICQQFIVTDVDINTMYSSHIRKMVFTRLDSIMYGVLGAYVYVTRRQLWNKYRNLSFVLGLLGILFVKFFPWQDYTLIKGVFYSSTLSLAVLFLLPKLNAWSMGNQPSWWKKVIVFISIVSYSAYLLNSSIINLLKRFMNYQEQPIIFCLAAWAITFFASWLLYTLVEYPMMKWRDRRFKKVAVENESV